MAEAPVGSPERSPEELAGSPRGSPRSGELLAEVKELKVTLDDGTSSEKALLEAIGSLQSQTIPTKILSETLIGKSMTNLAKNSPIDSVRDAAAKLVTAWRETHRKRKASFSIDRTQSAASMDSQVDSRPLSGLSGGLSGGLSSTGLSSMMSTDSLDVPGAPEEDKDKMTPKREKVREKIVDALGQTGKLETKDGSADDGMEMRDPVILAAEIETALHQAFFGQDKAEAKYLSQARAVLFNLKDKKNPIFRFKLSVGAIKPEQVPKLSPADMASEEKNAERKKQRDDAMAAIDQDWAMKNGQIRISGLFTCGKCKGTQTTYFQMQTRSSDEPMTTFASCLTCGNRWKFC